MKVLRSQVFAVAPVRSSLSGKAERMSFATLREVEMTCGAIKFEIENRAGDKMILDHDAFENLKLVIAGF